MSREEDQSMVAATTTKGDTLGVQQASSPRKKSNRRATAVYPAVNSSNKTSKPFSRSAAKRGSVMALGSIEHLQYYFTKAGLAAKEKPQSSSILVPAIGGLQYIRTSPSGEVQPILDDEHFVLPPTPIQPTNSPQYNFSTSPSRDYETDPETLKRVAVIDLKAVQEAWDLYPPSSPSPPADPQDSPDRAVRWDEPVDVLSILRNTTRVIRSVRNYVVSLPDDPSSLSLFVRPAPKPEYRPSTLQPTLTKRPVYHSRKFSQDILYQIRQSALDVLARLHSLEERTRLPLEDEAYEVQSDHGSTSSHSLSMATTSRERLSSPVFSEDDMMTESDASFSFSVVKVPGREEHIHVWTNEDDEALLEDNENNNSNKTGWDEKLVLGAGWLYQQDLTLGKLKEEREAVGRYLDAVDAVLFSGGGGKRGWDAVKLKVDTGRRRSSGGGSGGAETPPRGAEGGILFGGIGRQKGLLQSLESMRLSSSDDPGSPRRVVSPGGHLHDLREEDEDQGEEDEGGEGETREIPDEDLPDWARRTPSNKVLSQDPLARAHALLVQLLPASLLHLLPLPTDDSDSDLEDDTTSPITPTQHRGGKEKDDKVKVKETIPRIPFLQALSSGQLLCVAYNAALRRSRRPWGFVNLENVHDVVGMEIGGGGDRRQSGGGSGRNSGRNSQGVGEKNEEGDEEGSRRVGWTFRRVDNLRLWTAALRLRYQIPLSSSPLINKSSSDPPFLLFDAKTVARREAGWDTMLEGAVMRWVEEVVNDKRKGK